MIIVIAFIAKATVRISVCIMGKTTLITVNAQVKLVLFWDEVARYAESKVSVAL